MIFIVGIYFIKIRFGILGLKILAVSTTSMIFVAIAVKIEVVVALSNIVSVRFEFDFH